MYISLSSSDYTWYKYKGTRVVFKNHHDEYDLTLKPNEIFGIKGTQLVHADSQDIIFGMKKSECLALFKDSVELKYNHDLYPQLALPCTKASLRKIYDYFNAKLFNDECPDNVVFQSISNSRAEGTASYKNIKGKYFHYVQYNTGAMTDVPYFCTMVIHEMIHVLMNKRALEGKMEYHNASHGPMFQREMARVNKLGYKVTITAEYEDILSQESQEVYYVTRFVLNDKFVVFWSKTPFDPTDLLNDMHRTGYWPTSYVYGTCKRAITLKENPVVDGNIKFKSKIKYARSDYLGQIDIEKTRDIANEKRPEAAQRVITMVLRHHKLICLPKLHYLSSIFMNLGSKAANTTDINKMRESIKPNGFTDADFDYAIHSWESITARDIAKDPDLKEVRRAILKFDMSNEDAIERLVPVYLRNYVGRVDKQTYAEICAKSFDIITLPEKDIIRALMNKL